MKIIKRNLDLASELESSFFLWGPRQTGKTQLLKSSYPNAWYIDLLKTSNYLKYLEKPWLLREELEQSLKSGELATDQPVIIDEIQKVPLLLDEVHYLIENHDIKFALCGSSARKVKRGHANLLGGRALRYELYGFSAWELQDDFDLKQMLNAGYLPRHYLSKNPKLLLEAYIQDYLKEEIAEEALVRNVSKFSSFLSMAALCDTELLSYANFAREAGVSSHTVKSYFSILEDTLLARFLPAYTKRPKRRVIQAPKFYFTELGVVNFLAKRNTVEEKTDSFGKAFENWVLHELSLYNSYKKKFWDISYWRLASGIEVDFILGDMRVAIEAKARDNIHDKHLKGLKEVIKDFPQLEKRIVVSLVDTDRISNGIEILSANSFVKKLWQGELDF